MVDEIGTSVLYPNRGYRFFASGDLNKKGYRFGVTRSVPLQSSVPGYCRMYFNFFKSFTSIFSPSKNHLKKVIFFI